MDLPPKDIYHQEIPPPLARRRRLFGGPPRSSLDPASAVPPPGATRPGQGLRHDPGLHHDHRVRLRRRRSDHTPQAVSFNRVLWVSVAGLVLMYFGALGFLSLRARRAHHAPPPAPAPAAAAVSPSATAAPPLESIADDIQNWRKAQKLAEEGAGLADQQKLQEARERLRAALELDPHHAYAQTEMARVLFREKSFAEAEGLLRSALAAAPDAALPRLTLANAYLAGSYYSNALAVARWILEDDPYAVEAHGVAANALLGMDDPAQAIAHLRRLVTLNRDDLAAQNNLGVTLMKVQDFKTAQATFREILRSDANNSVAFYNLAVCHAKQGNVVDAVDTLSTASEKFGSGFVLTWTQSGDFDSIRSDARFAQFLQAGAAPLAKPAPQAGAVAAPAAASP